MLTNYSSVAPTKSLEIFQPLLFFLRLLGLHRGDQNLPKRARAVLTVVHLYFIYSLIYLTINSASYSRHRSTDLIMLNISEVVYCFACVFSLDYFVSRRKTIYGLLGVISLGNGRNTIQVRGVRREKRLCRFLVTFACLLCLYRFVTNQYWIYNYSEGSGIYSKIYLHGVNNYFTNAWWVRGFSFIERVSYTATAFTFLLLTFFVVMMARALTFKIAAFEETLASDDLKDICRRHGDLFDLTRRMEPHVDVLYRVWAVQWMVASVVNTPKMVQVAATSDGFILAAHFGFQAVVNLLVSVGVSLSLANIHEYQARVMTAVHLRLVSRTALDQAGSATDQEREATCRLLLAKVSSGPLQFKVCKSIVLTKYYILSFYSLIVSMVVAVTQELL